MTHHGVNQFDSVVFRWVVTGCDHDANSRITLLGAESGNETNSVNDMIQEGSIFHLFVSLENFLRKDRDVGGMSARAAERQTYAFMRN